MRVWRSLPLDTSGVLVEQIYRNQRISINLMVVVEVRTIHIIMS